MRASITICAATLGILAWSTAGATGQTESRSSEIDSPPPVRWAALPTDRSLRAESGLPIDESMPSELPRQTDQRPLDLKSLLRPRVDLSAAWEPEVEGLALGSYDLSIQMPVYPVFGPPPPFITAGYSLTQIDAPTEYDLASSLHEFSLGLAWMRRINDKWMTRTTVSAAFASDLDNTGSDAWRIRGGAFALYRPNEQWSFALGALATGRDDVPVIPGIGAIWEPSRDLKVNLMLPKPRVQYLIAESERRQHWGYVGGDMSGGAWAYDRASGWGDRLNYREWRLVLGWESAPPQPPGTFRLNGTRFNAEVGYVFGREIEFDSASPDISVGDALLLRTGMSF